MGRTWKEQKSGHVKNPNKKFPHKDSKFYKDEFHERKDGKFKKKFDKFED
jgi:hypothetical protein